MVKVNFYKRFIVYFLLFGLLISVFSGTLNYYYHHIMNQGILQQKSIDIFDIKIKSNIIPTLESYKNSVSQIANHPLLEKFIRTKDPKIKNEISLILQAIANTHKEYMQIRYLSTDGMEAIRVERKDKDIIEITPDKLLQNKSERYYFQQVSKLSKDSIWFSKIDLNMEHGKVVVPYEPTLRVAMPIYVDDEFSGVLIININISQLLDQISTSTVFDHYIIDSKHNYILHPKREYSFNRYTNIDRDIKEDFVHGLNDENVFIYPLDQIIPNSDHALFVLQPKALYAQKEVTFRR